MQESTPSQLPSGTSAPGGMPFLRLQDQVRARIRIKHYSIRTEDACLDWIKRYIRFHNKRRSREISATHVERCFGHLDTALGMAASAQNQAKSALLFLHEDVLQVELPWLDGVTQARVPKRLPMVLTSAEVTNGVARVPAELALLATYVAVALSRCLRHRGGARRAAR